MSRESLENPMLEECSSCRKRSCQPTKVYTCDGAKKLVLWNPRAVCRSIGIARKENTVLKYVHIRSTSDSLIGVWMTVLSQRKSTSCISSLLNQT
jgi:hypothetical protein